MADEIVSVKTCHKCGETKALGAFRKAKDGKCGTRGICKACESAYAKAYGAKYYADNRSKILAQQVSYRSAHRERAAKYYKAWREDNGDRKRKADAEYRSKNAEIISKRRAAYYLKNKGRIAAYKADYQAKNARMLREKQAAHYQKSKPQRSATRKAWYRENYQKVLTYGHNRRARKKGNGGRLSPDIAERLYKLQRGKCACCGKPLGEDYHLDHRIPLARGGKNENTNMQLLRQQCNNQKHAKDPIEFMQERGYLL